MAEMERGSLICVFFSHSVELFLMGFLDRVLSRCLVTPGPRFSPKNNPTYTGSCSLQKTLLLDFKFQYHCLHLMFLTGRGNEIFL